MLSTERQASSAQNVVMLVSHLIRWGLTPVHQAVIAVHLWLAHAFQQILVSHPDGMRMSSCFDQKSSSLCSRWRQLLSHLSRWGLTLGQQECHSCKLGGSKTRLEKTVTGCMCVLALAQLCSSVWVHEAEDSFMACPPMWGSATSSASCEHCIQGCRRFEPWNLL